MRSEIGKIHLDTVFKERDSLNVHIVGKVVSYKIVCRLLFHSPLGCCSYNVPLQWLGGGDILILVYSPEWLDGF